jgi:hypothetical protein
MSFVTAMYYARFQEELRERSRVKTTFALIILLAITALLSMTKAQEIPRGLFVASETLTGSATIEGGYIRFALENNTKQERAHGIYRVFGAVDLGAAEQAIIDEFGGKLTPDYVVKTVDHAFALPPDIKAGRHPWPFENLGHQDHFMFVCDLLPGKTLADVMTFRQGEGASPLVTARL